MGVHGLGTFVRSQGIDCEFELELTHFSGTAWGIDALNWIYREVPIVTKNILNDRNDSNIFEPILDDEVFKAVRKKMISFNKRLIDHNITPVWIWDGVSQNNKVSTQEERREKRKECREKRDALFEQLSSKDIMMLKEEEIKKWKNSVCSSTGLSRANVGKLKEFTTDVGIPTITSDDEAENLAASLSVEGKISLVWSNDTDNYPLGSVKVASEFKYMKGSIYVKGIEPCKIVSHLGMSFKIFRDFCILLGTDFHKRIKGMGPVASLKLIRQYKNIENIEKETKHNFSFFNYPSIRKQLTPYSTFYQIDTHLKAKKCYCPSKIESLELSYPDIDIRRIISSINDLKHRTDVEDSPVVG